VENQFALLVKGTFPCKVFFLFFPALVFQLSTARVQALPDNIGTVIMIGFENHNFKQPSPTSSPQQIFANAAAPYINSLITPGNSNATYVSYCTSYYNTGNGVHPSEPNYIWEEAGSNLGILADNDPSTANGNLFTVEHFVHQLDAAGISWHNYEEDVEYTTPIVSKSGTRPSGTNAYNGSTQYSYACKHNPMCFWTNSWEKNVNSLTNFIPDLHSGSLARYNWIMPDLENCMHTATTANFTYHGTTYTGGTDQCAIAEGDNFLSIIIPQIMASPVFTNNGVIIIRFDESEGGDTTNYTLPEILISPLAKGRAYASSVVMSHSSDVKTMEEIYGLNYTNSSGSNYMSNSIPSGETAATPAGTYNNIGGSTVNDLGDLFAVVQTPPSLTITKSGNSAIISWPSPSTGFYLQTNSNLTRTNWANYTGTIATNGAGTSNSVTVTPPVGNLFFRLANP
jgi:phosphatidylinositol-3-phosphatase